MTTNLTKRVKFTANERYDLVDKLAEGTLLDDTLAEYARGLVEDDPDGRVFFGWRSSTITGPNIGFTIAAEPAFAMSRDGKVLIRDGAAELTASLNSDAINYFHAYYDEADTDIDARRLYISGAEVSSNIPTRVTRTAGIYKITTAYGTGIPNFANFQTDANIGGVVRQLIPLYAVAVNSGDTVTSVNDYRPMWAPATLGAGGNKYEAEGTADIPFNFVAADGASLNITSTRDAIVAICDRLRNLKQTTNWYADNFNNVILSGNIFKTTSNSTLTVSGGSSASLGARLTFTGESYTTPNAANWYAQKYTFNTVGGSPIFTFDPVLRRIGVNTTSPTNTLHIRDENTTAETVGIWRYSNTETAFISCLRARGTISAPTIVDNNSVIGNVSGSAYNGSAYYNIAGVQFSIDGTPSGASLPSKISFFTTPSGSTTRSERMRVTNAGYVQIGPTTSNIKAAFDVNLNVYSTAAKFGASKPVYLVSDYPNIGFNVYWGSTGWRGGKGSVGNYGGILGFDVVSNLLYFYNTNSFNEDDVVTITSAFTVDGAGRMALGYLGNGIVNSRLTVHDGGIMIYRRPTGNCDASLHIAETYGPYGAHTLLHPNGASKSLLNFCADTDGGGAFRWFTWGIQSGYFKINSGFGFTDVGINIWPGGQLYCSQNIISGYADAFRAVQPTYGVIFRNDNSDYYILLTNAGDPYGPWNMLRPFRLNLGSGELFLNTRLHVSNDADIDGIMNLAKPPGYRNGLLIRDNLRGPNSTYAALRVEKAVEGTTNLTGVYSYCINPNPGGSAGTSIGMEGWAENDYSGWGARYNATCYFGIGVEGRAYNGFFSSGGDRIGVYGYADGSATATNVIAVRGIAYNGTTQTYGVYGFASSGAGSVYGVYAAGGSKNWVNPHRDDSSKSVVYSTVEAGDNKTFFSGRALLTNGRLEFTFPEHFQVVTSDTYPVFVTVTPRSTSSLGIAIISSDNVGFVAEELNSGNGTYEVDFVATGTRFGYEECEPIINTVDYVPHLGHQSDISSDMDSQDWYDSLAEGLQRIFKRNGMLLPNGRINEQHFHERGWRILKKINGDNDHMLVVDQDGETVINKKDKAIHLKKNKKPHHKL